ncbi:hypothetical protein PINS_up010624 [Pythium insidiosum]|nr:hypothetical protein PINS_up010624 [Pythium insidiosum]
MDHGVVHDFSVAGAIAGAATVPHARYRFSILADGSLVASAVVTPNGKAKARSIELQDGVAAVDHFGSTGDVRVYSARFRLVYRAAAHARRLILECRAQLATDRGLVGCWSDSTHRDQRFSFSLLHHQRYMDKPEARNPRDSSVSVLTPGRYIGRGKQRGPAGEMYSTKLSMVLDADGGVSGDSTEDGTRCTIRGSWCCDRIAYGLEYPARDDAERLDYYHFSGRVTAALAFSGDWYYVRKARDEDAVSGIFEFILQRDMESD